LLIIILLFPKKGAYNSFKVAYHSCIIPRFCIPQVQNRPQNIAGVSFPFTRFSIQLQMQEFSWLLCGFPPSSLKEFFHGSGLHLAKTWIISRTTGTRIIPGGLLKLQALSPDH